MTNETAPLKASLTDPSKALPIENIRSFFSELLTNSYPEGPATRLDAYEQRVLQLFFERKTEEEIFKELKINREKLSRELMIITHKLIHTQPYLNVDKVSADQEKNQTYGVISNTKDNEYEENSLRNRREQFIRKRAFFLEPSPMTRFYEFNVNKISSPKPRSSERESFDEEKFSHLKMNEINEGLTFAEEAMNNLSHAAEKAALKARAHNDEIEHLLGQLRAFREEASK
jgi:hypothetical protein